MKHEFKSPAEERLVRKMAKMALNGYEIGIQRKIKPADHIQSMAEKIQDTVVTKHPFNTDSTTSSDSSREGTLKRSINNIHERGYKTNENIQFIGDKIKNTIISNHPAGIPFTNGNVPVPPPIPTTPIPTFDIHSTPILSSIKKPVNDLTPITKNNFSKFVNELNQSPNNLEKINYDDKIKNEEMNKSIFRSDNSLNNILKTNITDKSLDTFNGSHKNNVKTDHNTDVNYSNTLSKRKLFEKLNTHIENKDISTKNNFIDLSHDTLSRTTNGSNNNVSKFSHTLNNDKINDYDKITDKSYNLKNEKIDNIMKENENSSDTKEDLEKETVVKRREKKTNKHDDGRRDSHIIARPLSTMTSVDVTDGLYPVCHKCDKAITR